MNSVQAMISRGLRIANKMEKERITQEEFSKAYFDFLGPLYDSGYFENRQSEFQFIKLQHTGGICPMCGQPWQPVKVDNNVARFEYFLPDCGCFPVCDFCGRVLFIEVQEGWRSCSNCFPPNICVPCDEWKEIQDYKGRVKTTKRVKCGGAMIPVPRGFKCEECGTFKKSLKKELTEY